VAERSFGLLFVLDAATCLAFAAIVAVTVPATTPAVPEDAEGNPLWDPLLLALTASSFAAAVVFLQWIVTLPLVMRDDGLDAAAYGVVAAVNPAVIVLAQPVLMRGLRAWSPVSVYAVSGVLTGVGFLLTGFADTVVGYAATVVVWTLGEIALNIAAPVILAAIAPVHMRARYQGVWGTSWGLAMFAAPLAGTWTLRHLGAWTLWLGCLVVACGSTLGLLLARPALRRRADEVSVAGGEHGSSRL
jgi:MFS family permease